MTDPLAPPEVPTPTRARSVRAADWLLRIAILLFAIGLARAYFTRYGSSFGAIALLEWNVPHAQILFGEKLAASVILTAAISVLFRPSLVALVFIAILVFAEGCAGVRAGGFHFSQYTPLANALRYLTPLALIPLISARGRSNSLVSRAAVSSWMLRIGLAVVFAVHGLEAWMLHPHFIDFIISSGRNLGDLAITEATASSALKVIAILDFIAAGLILFHRSVWLLGWLCFWGLVTALSRPVSLGLLSYPEVLMRASHVLVPVVVWCLWRFLHREKIGAVGERGHRSAPSE